MRLAKLSLAAIVALGVSAFADVENVKFGGDAKLYYGTADNTYVFNTDAANDYANPGSQKVNGDLFDQKSSYGQAALDLWATADVGDGAKAKIGVVMLNTLGLENNLVSNVWAGGTNNQWWVNEAWLAKSFGNTTFKLGRQELDTPLAFSEKWSIAANSFDAAVVLNSDLPKTTLVGAWVGRGNGTAGYVVRDASFGNDPFRSYGSAIVDTVLLQASVAQNANLFATTNIDDLADGAYAVAAVTKLIPMTTAQVWYYNVVNLADAWWLQADVNLDSVLPNLSFGVQFADINPTSRVDRIASALIGQTVTIDDSKGWALQIGYNYEGFKLKGAYSSMDDGGVFAIANTATGLAAGGAFGSGSQSKLYTEAWWNYGYVGAPNADTLSLSAEYDMEGIANFGAYYTSVNDAEPYKLMDAINGDPVTKVDMTEFTLTASKSFGSLDATLAYIYTDADDQNFDDNGKSDSFNTIQVYLTYNF